MTSPIVQAVPIKVGLIRGKYFGYLVLHGGDSRKEPKSILLIFLQVEMDYTQPI